MHVQTMPIVHLLCFVTKELAETHRARLLPAVSVADPPPLRLRLRLGQALHLFPLPHLSAPVPVRPIVNVPPP
jgi:hypothetical protein